MMDRDEFVRAFERNCPRVRMTDEERTELARLFAETQKDAKDHGRSEAVKEINENAKRAGKASA